MPDTTIIRLVAGLGAEPTDRGVSSVEYALLIALIAAVIVGSVATLGLSVDGLFGVDLSPDP